MNKSIRGFGNENNLQIENITNWKCENPPSSSDIRWDSFKKNQHWFNSDKIFAMIIYLVLITVLGVCISPMSFLNQEFKSKVSGLGPLISGEIAPLYLMLTNYIVIPQIVN